MSVKILFGQAHSLDRFISELPELLFCPVVYYRDVCTLYSVDLDQTHRSDPNLYCLQLSLLWDARHKSVNNIPKRGHNWILKH